MSTRKNLVLVQDYCSERENSPSSFDCCCCALLSGFSTMKSGGRGILGGEGERGEGRCLGMGGMEGGIGRMGAYKRIGASSAG